MVDETRTHREVISSFTGKYRPLSNFWYADVYPFWWPLTLPAFPSNEHAFQAWKVDPNNRAYTDREKNVWNWLDMVENIRSASSATAAKTKGRSIISIRPDWEDLKVDVMRYLVQLKFRRHSNLLQLLLDTGDADLIEGNTWGDQFWGATWDKDFGWTGLNWLGTLLMEEREVHSGN